MKHLEELNNNINNKLCDYCVGHADEEILKTEDLLYKLSKALTTTTEYTKYWSGQWYVTKCPICNKKVYGTGTKPEHTSECVLKIAEEIVKEYEEENNE